MFLKYVLIQIYFSNRILGKEKKTFKSLESTLPFHMLKASILNPGIIIFGVIIDAFITPPLFEGLVISCDMIICMGACYCFPCCWKRTHL